MNKEEELIRKKSPVNIRNKKASFEYFFIETYTAGIVLTGTEIKSIRLGKASLVDTYCYIVNNELWVRGMNISPYFYGSYNNHEMKRDRKLLLTRREINKRLTNWLLPRNRRAIRSFRCSYSLTSMDGQRWILRSVRERKNSISA